jgi:hypothetical protein
MGPQARRTSFPNDWKAILNRHSQRKTPPYREARYETSRDLIHGCMERNFANFRRNSVAGTRENDGSKLWRTDAERLTSTGSILVALNLWHSS